MVILIWGYILTTLILTTLWVYFLRDRSFGYLSYAMFFPSIIACVFSCFSDELPPRLFLARAFSVDGWTLGYCLLGLVIEAVTIVSCALLSYLLGWARRSPASNQQSSLHAHNQEILAGFLRAAGEELGWRSFMVPLLLSTYSPLATCLISGITWGAYHIPIMILLGVKLKPERPLITIAVQFFSCVVHAFPYALIAHHANFSFLPPAMMHWFWNRLNPWLLGSIYTQKPGFFEGNQWLINGEGLSGCIIGSILGIIVLFQM